jgi:peptidoglycan/LPS O-acetylase OafA/YrhL
MVWQLSRLRLPFLNARPEAAPLELPRGHIPALDAIRGLAIVVVTLYRFGGGSDGPASAAVLPLIDLGSRGVDLFFVLSGFLITGILYDAKGREGYFRNFYARRTLRIFPLYYGALVVTLLVLPLVSTSLASVCQPAIERQWWLWLYGANIVQSLEGAWNLGPLNHFWSLAIEEHFYFVWPLIIFACSRIAAMRVCGCLIAASVLARAGWLATGGNDVAAEVFTLLRLDGLLIGAWLALVARSPGGLGWLTQLAKPAIVLSGVAAIAAWLLHKRLLGLPEFAWAALCGSALVLIVAAGQTSLRARFGNSQTLQFFGKYSYAMYVFQLPLIFVVAPLVTAPGLARLLTSPWLGQAAYCGLMFGLTTLLALASWHLFEKHCLKLKHRFGG